jgi:hypothetical protein
LARDISDVLSSVNEAMSPLGRQSACEAVSTAQDVSAAHESAGDVPQHLAPGGASGEITSGCMSATQVCSQTVPESESTAACSDEMPAVMSKAMSHDLPLEDVAMLKNAASPNRLEIAVSDDENDIDALLEEKSEKIKLTASNVRSIIHVSF